MKFYDPKDADDQARVERVLKAGAIEYFLFPSPESGLGPKQVHVAEEDLPTAQELLNKAKSDS